ncbi:MAG: hypothetical protein WCJ01_05610 [Ignavibacteria bacterium]
MNLISFVFKTRLNFFFKGEGSASRITGLTIFSLLALFYGRVSAYFLDNSFIPDTLQMKINIIRGIFSLLFLSTITRVYLPGYKPKTDFIPAVFPVSHGKRFLIDLLADFLYPYFFVLLLFITVIKIFSSEFDIYFYLQAISALFSGHFIRRIFQSSAERKLKLNAMTVIFIVINLAVCIFIIYQFNYRTLSHNLTSLALTLAVMVALFATDSIIERSVIESGITSGGRSYKSSRLDNSAAVFILRNKSARKTIMVAMLLKLFFIVLDLGIYSQSGRHLFSNMYIVWIYVSPVILFSYIYSNTWGFYRSLWFTIDKCTGDFKKIVTMQLKIMAFPFILDFLTASVYFILNKEDIVFGFAFYFTSLLLIIPFSITASITGARYVGKPLSFRANSSTGVRFGAIALVSSIFLIKFYPFLKWAVLLYIAAAYFSLKYIAGKYPAYKYVIFGKLFHSGKS